MWNSLPLDLCGAGSISSFRAPSQRSFPDHPSSQSILSSSVAFFKALITIWSYLRYLPAFLLSPPQNHQLREGTTTSAWPGPEYGMHLMDDSWMTDWRSLRYPLICDGPRPHLCGSCCPRVTATHPQAEVRKNWAGWNLSCVAGALSGHCVKHFWTELEQQTLAAVTSQSKIDLFLNCTPA